MSLVRHLVAPPAGRATADTDPLGFDLAVNPDPLRISPSTGAPAKGDLIVVASLDAEAPVECRAFTVTLKVGPGETDLCSSLSGVTGRISLAGWTATLNAAAGTLTFAPGQGVPAQTEFGTDTGVTFQVMGLPINQRVGLSQVDIGASWRPPGTAGWQQQTTRLEVGKFPLGFHLRSFVAEPQSVANGGSVTLRWDASAATSLSLYYDGEVHPVTGETSVTVPDMKQTTFFHLRAVAQDGAGSVERTLSTLVQVPDPELTVGRVIVHGTVQVGSISPTGDAGDLIVFPQRPPATPEVLGTAGFEWQDSHWIRSALPTGPPALFSHTSGQSPQASHQPYVELIYQPLGSSELVWSSFDGYAWTRVEEPFGPGADPSISIKTALLVLPVLWVAYRGGENNTQVLTRTMQLTGRWGTPKPPPGDVTTEFRPALVNHEKALLLAATDRTDAPPMYWTFDKDGWSSPRRFPGVAASGAPAFAVLGNTLVCVYPTTNGYFVAYELPGAPISHERWKAGPTMPSGPRPSGMCSLAAHEGRLYCVYRDSDGHAQLMSYDGTTWTSPSPVSDRKYHHHPALVATGGRLWLF